MISKNDQHDLRAYVAAAWNLLRGRPLYVRYRGIPEDAGLTTDIPYFIYPPIVAVLFIPATLFRFDTLRVIWGLCSYVFACITIGCVAPSWLVGVLAGGMLFAGYPWQWHQRCGQIDMFIYMLVAVGYALFTNGAYQLAGFVLALACWCKVTPGVVALYFCVLSSGFLYWWACYMLILFAVQLAISPRDLFCWFYRIRQVTSWRFEPPAIQSLCVIIPNNLFRICTSLVMLAGVVTIRDPLTGLALCCICMMMIPNVGWIMNHVGMVIPYVALIKYFLNYNAVAFLPLCFIMIQPRLRGCAWCAVVAYLVLYCLSW